MFQREINEVFEQFKLSDELHRSVSDEHSKNNKLLPENENAESKINNNNNNNSNHNGNVNTNICSNNCATKNQLQENVQNEEVIKTTEWANTILKELDNLMQSDKPSTNGDEDFDLQLLPKRTHFGKNAATNILKPKKHVSYLHMVQFYFFCMSEKSCI